MFTYESSGESEEGAPLDRARKLARAAVRDFIAASADGDDRAAEDALYRAWKAYESTEVE
jgi:hypothetical protein